MRKALIALGMSAVLSLGTAGLAHAANPPGTGQPSQECGEEGATSSPAGFNTSGFANAESHYADGDGHNVSQYDVACYEVTQAGH